MISFLPAVRLRPLGKQVEVKNFDRATVGLSSIEKLMAGVLYRFALDTKCPAIFIMSPKAGDEPLDGLTFLKDFDKVRFMELADLMFADAVDNFGTDDISLYTLSDRVYMLLKNNFRQGAWEDYGFEISGKDGISIPC